MPPLVALMALLALAPVADAASVPGEPAGAAARAMVAREEQGFLVYVGANASAAGQRLDLYVGDAERAQCECDELAPVNGTWRLSLVADDGGALAGARPDAPARAAPADAPARSYATVAAAGALALALRLALPLYSRLARDRVLLHPRRARLLELLADRPGLHAREIARATGIPRAAVAHHLAVLRAHGLATTRRACGVLGWFVAGPSAGREERLALAQPRRRAVAEAVAASPATQEELATRAGVTRRLAAYHLEALRREGLVEATEERPRRYAATPRLAAALRDAPPTT